MTTPRRGVEGGVGHNSHACLHGKAAVHESSCEPHLSDHACERNSETTMQQLAPAVAEISTADKYSSTGTHLRRGNSHTVRNVRNPPDRRGGASQNSRLLLANRIITHQVPLCYLVTGGSTFPRHLSKGTVSLTRNVLHTSRLTRADV